MRTLTINALSEQLLKTVANGLHRTTITNCSRWACSYRFMGRPFPGKWGHTRHPWLHEFQEMDDPFIAIQKGAQLGFTEGCINKCFYEIDVNGVSVLYLLPTTGAAGDFSKTRFDPALQMSDYISAMFTDTNNVGLKVAQNGASLYVRGSGSRTNIKSIPVAITVLDEIDEMTAEAVSLVDARQDGQEADVGATQLIKLSTPTVPGEGINVDYLQSTQALYRFDCPHCGKRIHLDFISEDEPHSLIITGDDLHDPGLKDSYICCYKCKKKLPFEQKVNFLKHKGLGGNACFEAEHPNREIKGLNVNQLYASTKGGLPFNFAKAVILARHDPTREQELWNSKLARAKAVTGAKLTDLEYAECVAQRRYIRGPEIIRQGQIVTMGGDIGAKIHLVFYGWDPIDAHANMPVNEKYEPSVIDAVELTANTIVDFKHLDEAFCDYKTHAGVLDSQPATRLVKSFACKYPGLIYLCHYLNSANSRELSYDKKQFTVQIHRTSWMDLMFSRFKSGSIPVPSDMPPDFKKHLQEPTRVFLRDKFNNPIGQYTGTNSKKATLGAFVNTNPDHYVHACTYAEVALPFAIAGKDSSANIEDLW